MSEDRRSLEARIELLSEEVAALRQRVGCFDWSVQAPIYDALMEDAAAGRRI